MKTGFAILSIILGLGAPATAADVFLRYAETVWLHVDGTARLDVEVDCPTGTTSPVRLPLNRALTDLTIGGVEQATVSNVSEGERRYISIEFPSPLAAPATLRTSGSADRLFTGMTAPPKAFGNRSITYRFLNTTPADFAAVSTQIVLPDGYVVTSVDDSEPPANESSTTPPFAVVSRDGRHAVSVKAAHVGLGDAASVTFRFKERKVSPLISIALLALGAGYLAGFRSLVSGADPRS